MRLTITADFRELDTFIKNLVAKRPEIKPALFEVVKDVADDLDRRIDAAMPKDTGRAAAGWGKYRPELLAGGSVPTPLGHFITRASRRTHQPQVSSAADAVWEEHPEGLYIIEGTRVPYVQQLNEGSSTQAPAGFIDVAVALAGFELEAKAAARFAKELAQL